MSGTDLVAVEDIVVDASGDGTKSRRTDFYPAPVVEGMLATALVEIKHALDATGDTRALGMKAIKRTKACYAVTRGIVEETYGWLEPYNRASLNKKHLLCRDIFEEMRHRLRNNDVMSAKVMRNKKVIKFARDMVEFLTAFHLVLTEQSNWDQRYAAADQFCVSVE